MKAILDRIHNLARNALDPDTPLRLIKYSTYAHTEMAAFANMQLGSNNDNNDDPKINHKAKLAKAGLIKQGMMQELLTGRIRLV